MAAQALGLGTIAQGTMASYVGTTTEGSSSEGIKNGLNGRLSAAGSSLRYRHALTSSYNLLNCIKTSIDKGAPVIVNVKVIPNRYSVQSGHFILVIGYWINSLPVSSTGDVSMQAEPNSSQTIVLRYIDPHYDDTKFGIFEISYADLLSACNSGEGTYGHFVYVYTTTQPAEGEMLRPQSIKPGQSIKLPFRGVGWALRASKRPYHQITDP